MADPIKVIADQCRNLLDRVKVLEQGAKDTKNALSVQTQIAGAPATDPIARILPVLVTSINVTNNWAVGQLIYPTSATTTAIDTEAPGPFTAIIPAGASAPNVGDNVFFGYLGNYGGAGVYQLMANPGNSMIAGIIQLPLPTVTSGLYPAHPYTWRQWDLTNPYTGLSRTLIGSAFANAFEMNDSGVILDGTAVWMQKYHDTSINTDVYWFFFPLAVC